MRWLLGCRPFGSVEVSTSDPGAGRPRIVHIGSDSQFLQFAAKSFESVAPGANEYIVLTDSDPAQLRFPIPEGTVQVVSPYPRGLLKIGLGLGRCDMIIAHSMTAHAALAFVLARKRVATVWSGWGFDYYGSDKSPNDGLLGDATRSLSQTLARREVVGQRPLNRAVDSLWNPFARMLIRRAAARANYFSAPVPTDEQVFRNRFPRFQGKYRQLSYASVNDTFALGGAPNGDFEGILIGNSASLANNHLEAFEMLSRVGIGNRKVVVPLSYGDLAYRDVLLACGRELFGDAFRPLVQPLPLDEYATLVANCDIVIMNHKRQQALGNIGAALYHGAHVFFDPVNPAFTFLRSRGAAVYSVAQLQRNGIPARRATAEEVTNNRRVLESFWGTDQVRRNVERLLAPR